jgi:putative heme iron utilization protein
MEAAAEARRLVAAQTSGTLATSSSGHPWASLVAYAPLPDGTPVLLVSTFAEHGRNLRTDPRASLCVPDPGDGDPLGRARVTLAGRAEQADGDGPRGVFVAAVPSARRYIDFADFAFYLLQIERVRWVGGFGRMETVEPDEYAAVRS